MRVTLLALFSLSLCCSPLWAQEETAISPEAVVDTVGEAEAEGEDAVADDEPDESDDTAAETLVATLKERFAALAELLAHVQDAETAAELAPEVQQHFSMLLTTDAAALADADEEELADEFAEAFAPIDAELARLEEADFFGCENLRAVFAEGEDAAEAEDGDYVFPLGPLDFLRGNKAQDRHVCPRHEGGLQLLDWAQE